MPTRERRRGEATARTSSSPVRIRFPSRRTACRSASRVSRWLRGNGLGADGSGAGGVLRRQLNGQPLTTLLAAPAQRGAPPLRGHARAEAVRPDPALVAGTVGGLAHENSRSLNEILRYRPGKVDGPGSWGNTLGSCDGRCPVRGAVIPRERVSATERSP